MKMRLIGILLGLFFGVGVAFGGILGGILGGVTLSSTRGALTGFCRGVYEEYGLQTESRVRVVGVRVDAPAGVLEVDFSPSLAQISLRDWHVAEFYDGVRAAMRLRFGGDWSGVDLKLRSAGVLLEDYVPNLYRGAYRPQDSGRKIVPRPGAQAVERLDYGQGYALGLSGRSIALWPSHGYYFETRDSLPVWKFQRPAMFSTVEDLHTFEYVESYLAPMLENAGAWLYVPRERCTNPVEVLVDSDYSTAGSSVRVVRGLWHRHSGGYMHGGVLGGGANPHRAGSFMQSVGGAEVQFRGLLPLAGRYGVSVCYPALSGNQPSVLVRVHHLGGVAEFRLNQQLLGSTWVHLGRWDFSAGEALVEFVGDSGSRGTISVDAVRFGGGMGSVERGGAVSGLARWMEASRYYMQFCGVPDSIYRVGEHEFAAQVALDHKLGVDAPVEQDYADDFKSRGEWVNWLVEHGGVDVDLSFGMHTNSGIVDSIFGTLAIHTTRKIKDKDTVRVLRNGTSRMTNRDYSEIVLHEVVTTLRTNVTSRWTQRANYDKLYSESMRPEVPSMMLEMFSHQNQGDMEYALRPDFRFWMSRAIYVGMLKYLACVNDTDYVVQPLPPHVLGLSGGVLRWAEHPDTLNPTAHPTRWLVFGSRDGVVFTEIARIDAQPNTNQSCNVAHSGMQQFYVVGENGGGRSMPSVRYSLQGVACGYHTDLSYTGEVYDANPQSPFVDNENPGHGASRTDFLGIGRTFLHPSLQ